MSFTGGFRDESAMLFTCVKLGDLSGRTIYHLFGWNANISGVLFAAVFLFQGWNTNFIDYIFAYWFVECNILKDDLTVIFSTTNLCWCYPANLCLNFFRFNFTISSVWNKTHRRYIEIRSTIYSSRVDDATPPC